MPKDKKSGYTSSWGLILSVILHGVIMILIVFWGVKKYTEPDISGSIDVNLSEMRFENPGGEGRTGQPPGGDGNDQTKAASADKQMPKKEKPEPVKEQSAEKKSGENEIKPLFRQEVKVPEKKEPEQKRVKEEKQVEEEPETDEKQVSREKKAPEKKEPPKAPESVKKETARIPLEKVEKKETAKKKEEPAEKKPEPEKEKAVPEKEEKTDALAKKTEKKPEKPVQPEKPSPPETVQEKPAAAREQVDDSDGEDALVARKNVIDDLKRRNIIGSLKRNNETTDNGDGSSKVSTSVNKPSGGGGSGSGQGSPQVNPTVLKLFQQSISRKIKQKFKMPPSIPKDGSLNTEISFKIDKYGNVSSVKVEKSSGNPSFDKYCVNAVYSSSPFPSPPTELVKLSQTEGFVIDMNNEG